MNPLEKILTAYKAAGKLDWSVYDVARTAKVPTWQASGWIQSYFRQQRLKTLGSRPSLVIHRVEGTRTRGARYRIGAMTPEASDLVHALASDLVCAYQRRTGKDLRAMTDADPATQAKFAASQNALDLQLQAFVAFVAAL